MMLCVMEVQTFATITLRLYTCYATTLHMLTYLIQRHVSDAVLVRHSINGTNAV